jgi:hypothetical protein
VAAGRNGGDRRHPVPHDYRVSPARLNSASIWVLHFLAAT